MLICPNKYKLRDPLLLEWYSIRVESLGSLSWYAQMTRRVSSYNINIMMKSHNHEAR